MTFQISSTSEKSVMRCPRCNFDAGLHIEDVLVDAFAREDNPSAFIHLDATGSIKTSRSVESEYRRHGVGLVGWCEGCGSNFILWFRQHKGVTLGSFIETGVNDDLGHPPAHRDIWGLLRRREV